MDKAIKLNASNLSLLPTEVIVPSYDRSKVKCGIVHVGIGGFHRAHQAVYTDDLLKCGSSTDWGIFGIALLDADRKMFETLENQDGLYTLIITEPNGRMKARAIVSLV